MATTTVYGCDWCDTIVEKRHDGTPIYAAKIKARQFGLLKPDTPQIATYDICPKCRDAFQALTQGKYRR
jgi:hypothetical protein